jgi:hypothetical protein
MLGSAIHMLDDPIVNTDKIEQSRKLYEEIHQTHTKYLTFWKETTLWHWEFWLSLFLKEPYISYFFVNQFTNFSANNRNAIQIPYSIHDHSFYMFLCYSLMVLWHSSTTLWETIKNRKMIVRGAYRMNLTIKMFKGKSGQIQIFS